MSLRPLLDIALEEGGFRSLATAAREGGGPVRGRVSAALRPYLIAALVEAEYGLGGLPALVVTPDDRSARDLAADLAAFLAPRRVRHYPSRGTGYESHIAPPPHLVGLRIAALDALTGAADGEAGEGGEPPPVVVASAIALAEAVPDASLRPVGFSLQVGELVDLPDLAELLAVCGYERADQVSERGQFAVRGGILDVFPATEDRAIRVELDGDEVESLRWFSTFTQRSLDDAQRVELAPAAEIAAEHRGEAGGDGGPPDITEVLPLDRFGPFLDLLPAEAVIVLAAEDEIGPALADHREDVSASLRPADAGRLYVEVAEPLAARARVALSATLTTAEADGDGQLPELRAQRAESVARNLGEAEGELEKLVRSGYRVVVTFEQRGEAERTRFNLNRVDAAMLEGPLTPQEPGVWFAAAPLLEGFVAPTLGLAVFPYRRLVHRRRPAAPMPSRARLAAFTELRVGDHVVHEDHGVARFAGFETKTVAAITRDYLELEYRDSDRVFVPTDQLAKLSRYLGPEGHAPALSKLGGKAWEAVRSRARRAARELAGELINLYAERRARPGHGFGADGEDQLAFERAFAYLETPDQLEAIEAVKEDMEAATPMDRLICGDVGYGKTEVAMRAAHKAALDGKQTLVLVPTTILAQQHLGTFGERFAATPVTVEMVSRLRQPAEAKRALAGFADGGVDILIGTHRLLSADVRAHDLGLVVVDEEQRFGVRQKDLLRQLRLRVDVLSLSATPIPRTLQMGLAGLRDISVIETPPEGRQPVRTFVGPYEEQLVGRAIERETERGGQVFFLHNRVESLHETAERLRALCPGVRFAEAHGQMDERELETAMLGFLRGEADCLVATTIIEAGLDVPTANTLIVERADRLGLAQAYQIRGRVGRSRERAFAYLLYPSAEALSQQAAARLATLADHTELGSGFRIAMRDLELRGAGDLLGPEQSGHVAAVGFELYCAMLDQAVEGLEAGRAAGEPAPEPLIDLRIDLDVDAYVPVEYVPFEAAKIDIHRRIAGAREGAELAALRAEIEDRFGPLPEPVENLLKIQRAKIDARASLV